jgi:hypothetical protein
MLGLDAQHVCGPRPRGRSPARPRPASTVHGGAVRGGDAARLPHGGALIGAREMAGETWRGSPARGRRHGTAA